MFRDDQHSINSSEIRYPFEIKKKKLWEMRICEIVFRVSMNIQGDQSIWKFCLNTLKKPYTVSTRTKPMNKQTKNNFRLSTRMVHTFVIELVRYGIAGYGWSQRKKKMDWMNNFTHNISNSNKKKIEEAWMPLRWCLHNDVVVHSSVFACVIFIQLWLAFLEKFSLHFDSHLIENDFNLNSSLLISDSKIPNFMQS